MMNAVVISLFATIFPFYSGAATCLKNCQLSESDLYFTRREEGCVATVYKDSGGNDTIGCGHLLKTGESFIFLTPGQQERLLETDMQSVVKAINISDKRPLKQNEVIAIADLLYNVGTGDKQAFFKRVNAKNNPGFNLYEYARIGGQERKLKGLETRRQAEAQLYAL
jgi:GH24 family phage-related lysozyme (muramidase)